MPQSPIRGVVFDAVGTLLHPQRPIMEVYADLAQRHGVSVPLPTIRERFLAAYRKQEHHDRQHAWHTSEDRERQRWSAIVHAVFEPDSTAEQAAACFDSLYEHYAQPSTWRVDADADALFARLHQQGVRLGLASNYDLRLQRVLVGHPEFRWLLPNVAISSQVGVRKPGRGFFEHVAHMMQCEPGELLYMGDDRDNDYEGAMAAGLRAVWLDPHDRDPAVPHRIRRLAEVRV
jgi:putative hydrolase of the HAD superfamily